jgi:hypothetical protein
MDAVMTNITEYCKKHCGETAKVCPLEKPDKNLCHAGYWADDILEEIGNSSVEVYDVLRKILREMPLSLFIHYGKIIREYIKDS